MNIDHLTPENFRELLSSIAFLLGILFSVASIPAYWREHCLRMTGLFLLVGLALFANSPSVYFATVFIVATAVTQLEFLQNLAAIIRGSKEYFDYQKEFLSQKEVEKTAEKEAKEIEAAPVEVTEIQDRKTLNLSIDTSNVTPMQFGLLVEQFTFNFLERKYGKPIQRYVRFKGKRGSVEFDGVMQGEDTDLLFEIKTSRRGVIPVSFLLDIVTRYVHKVRTYKDITKRPASLRIVLVGSYPPAYIQKLISNKEEVLGDANDVDVAFETYTFEDVGLPDLLKEPAR
jgi:hypothetical protein